jgi:hypothetical protein
VEVPKAAQPRNDEQRGGNVPETRQELADLIDAFNKAWVRPSTWAEGEFDEASVRLRGIWAGERDKWTVNLLDFIRTWLLWPQDGPDAPDEQGLQSWAQNIAQFRDNMTLGAEIVEREILEGLEGQGT